MLTLKITNPVNNFKETSIIDSEEQNIIIGKGFVCNIIKGETTAALPR